MHLIHILRKPGGSRCGDWQEDRDQEFALQHRRLGWLDRPGSGGIERHNKRVWRGVWTVDPDSGISLLTTDEVTFWGVTGQKLATYQIQVVTGNGSAARRCG